MKDMGGYKKSGGSKKQKVKKHKESCKNKGLLLKLFLGNTGSAAFEQGQCDCSEEYEEEEHGGGSHGGHDGGYKGSGGNKGGGGNKGDDKAEMAGGLLALLTDIIGAGGGLPGMKDKGGMDLPGMGDMKMPGMEGWPGM